MVVARRQSRWAGRGPPQNACALVQAGAGIALVDQFSARSWSTSHFVARPLEGAPTLNAYLVRLRDEPHSQLSHTFVETLKWPGFGQLETFIQIFTRTFGRPLHPKQATYARDHIDRRSPPRATTIMLMASVSASITGTGAPPGSRSNRQVGGAGIKGPGACKP